MAYIIASRTRRCRPDTRWISPIADRLKLIGALTVLIALWTVAAARPAYAVRICGATQNPSDVICGGTGANSAAGACGSGQYCCNETSPASCGGTAAATQCNSRFDICQMPTLAECTNQVNPACTVQPAPINGCASGQYCCQHGSDNTPSCGANVVNLEVYAAGCRLPSASICLAGNATPSPSPTVTPSPSPTLTPTASPTPTTSPTATGTPTATPAPTVTPTPSPLVCGGNHRELAVVNQSGNPLWVGGGGGALRATCTISQTKQCLPAVGDFNANSCSCGKVGGTLTCPGSSQPSNGGLNCSPGAHQNCGLGAAANPNSGYCYFLLPAPSKLIGLADSKPADWDWQLTPGAEADFCVAPSTVTFEDQKIPSEVWWSGGVFARTGCLTGASNDGTACTTGDCTAQPGSNCPAGVGGTNPATIAEFTLQRTATDFYDVTDINGMNIAEEMRPLAQPTAAVPNPTASAAADYWCQAPGARSGAAGGNNCGWNPAPYAASVPLSTGAADETPLLINTTSLCWTHRNRQTRNRLPACPAGYTCSGDNGTCYETCTSDGDCNGLKCIAAGNGSSYCQCQSESDCASSNLGHYCGSEFGNGLGVFLQQCGPFNGWWSANDLCANPATVYGGLNCGASITDGDSNTTNLSSLFGCNGAGGTGNPANEASCYNPSAATAGCCGCGTSSDNTLVSDWPTDPTGDCGDNNTAWAAQIQPWLVNLKKSCPTAYSYPFDDFTSTFQCQGQGAINRLGYMITFSDLVVPPTPTPTP